MIGIFDSGSGGLTFLQECQKILPEYDYVYFGDYKNCPYGNKSRAEILRLTKQGVLRLREFGAKMVILACNTATWAAIRDLQSDTELADIKILGVTIPGAEKIVEENFKKVAVFATQASTDNHLYKDRVHILDESVQLQEIAMPELAVLVEDFLSEKISEKFLEEYIVGKSKNFDEKNEAIVLGCTHYSLVKNIFEKIFPKQILICPSEEASKKLKIYLQKHTEIEKKLSKNGKIFDISEKYIHET